MQALEKGNERDVYENRKDIHGGSVRLIGAGAVLTNDGMVINYGTLVNNGSLNL